MIIRILILSFLGSLPFGSVLAQIKGLDTTAHKRYPLDIKYVTWKQNDNYIQIDTNLSNLFLHRPNEQLFSMHDLGNIGLPAFDMTLHINHDPLYRTGIEIFNPLIYKIDELPFYKVRRPYTELYYTLGSKNEQILKVLLAQRLCENVFAGFNMQYASASGFYQRVKAPYNSFSGYVHFNSKRQRFNTRLGFVVNRLRAPINGGVMSDTFLNDPNITQKILEPVRLDTAVLRLKQTAALWQISYALGRLQTDTIKKRTIYQLHKRIEFQNSFLYTHSKYIFSDDSSDIAFYYVPFTQYSINDSIAVHTFKDELAIKYFNTGTGKKLTEIGAGELYNKIIQPNNISEYRQVYIRVYQTGGVGAPKRFKAIKDMLLSYEIKGLFAQDLKARTSNELYAAINLSNQQVNRIDTAIRNHTGIMHVQDNYHVAEKYRLALFVHQSSTPAALLDNNFATTLYNWNAHFTNQLAFETGVQFAGRNLKIKITNSTVSGYVYHNLDALPVQFTGTFNYAQMAINTRFKLIGKFYTADEIIIQKANNEAVVNIPAFITRAQLYFESDAFHNASHVQLGIMIRYWTDYYAPAFNPATFSFNLQQEKVVQTTPVADVYASMQIKTAQLFLRFTNIGNYIIHNVNYGALHYPLSDATIHFGVKWVMWN